MTVRSSWLTRETDRSLERGLRRGLVPYGSALFSVARLKRLCLECEIDLLLNAMRHGDKFMYTTLMR